MVPKLKSIISEIASSLLALLFVYAAVSKLAAFDDFKTALGKSPYTSALSKPISWLLPALEIATVMLLAFYRWRLKGLYLSLFLLTMFTTYIILMLNFSYYIPCSCGGVIASLSWKQHVYFNLAFMLLNLTGILLYEKTLQANNLNRKSSADKGEAENLESRRIHHY